MSHGHTTNHHGSDGLAFDPTDPHGATHHEHVIIPRRTLMNVLLVLLFFTLLTVGLSRAEVWAADFFNVVIPQWVNVAIAMSIATVKGLLVLLFFMQLKYDNKLNAIIFSNCIFAVGLFLFFSMIDLGNRGVIYDWKKGEIAVGGTGGISRGSGDSKETVTGGVVNFAREKYLAEWGPEKFDRIKASVKHEHAHHAAAQHAQLQPRRPRLNGRALHNRARGSARPRRRQPRPSGARRARRRRQARAGSRPRRAQGICAQGSRARRPLKSRPAPAARSALADARRPPMTAAPTSRAPDAPAPPRRPIARRAPRSPPRRGFARAPRCVLLVHGRARQQRALGQDPPGLHEGQ
jgi:cytochrome c oxidase subunit 4